MPVRRALSTIRLVQWADVSPLLRIRVVGHVQAKRSGAQILVRTIGQGITLRAVIAVDDTDGEATVAVDADLLATWGVAPAVVWDAARSNTINAMAVDRNEAATSSNHQGWRLTFHVGSNHVGAHTSQLLDHPPDAVSVWWSILAAHAMVVLRPLGKPSESDEEGARALVAGLASATDGPFHNNLFVTGSGPEQQLATSARKQAKR